MSFASTFGELTARLQEFIDSSSRGLEPSRAFDFDSLALDLFALQHKHNAAYQSFCEARNATPATVRRWTEIPAVPAAAFKELDLSCLAGAERTTVFHSSGTTGQQPSRHFHNALSLAVYEASLLSWFFAAVVPDDSPAQAHYDSHPLGRGAWRLAILTPPPTQAPNSSLVYMFDTLRRAFGKGSSVFLGSVGPDDRWNLDFQPVVTFLEPSSSGNDPALLLGTAFSYVHLLDYLVAQRLQFTLAPGSLVLETGGYKGLSRSMPKSQLYSLIGEFLGVQPTNIICEYGMSELSSQAYDRSPGRTSPKSPPNPNHRTFHFPPWARAQVVSPETGQEVQEGETGLLRIFDLANVYSVMAIQTEDLGTRHAQGFELLGRASLAEPRGCSLMVA